MKAAVLIPSYRRPADLARCLAALTEQTRSPDLVLVVVRVGDEETAALVPAWLNHLPIDLVKVTAPGVVHAMNAGLARCAADIVAITDDDAAPRADWLACIEANFAADPELGGVGGRDWIQQNGSTETGRKTWWAASSGSAASSAITISASARRVRSISSKALTAPSARRHSLLSASIRACAVPAPRYTGNSVFASPLNVPAGVWSTIPLSSSTTFPPAASTVTAATPSIPRPQRIAPSIFAWRSAQSTPPGAAQPRSSGTI